MILLYPLKYMDRTGSLEVTEGKWQGLDGRDRAAGPRAGDRHPGERHPEGGWFRMCTADGAPDGRGFGSGGLGGAGFGSVAEALRAGDMVVEYLNSPAAGELEGAACGEALVAIGRIASRLAAAQAGLLARFDAASAHDGDGYATTAAWLAGKTRLSRKDARAAGRQMRLLGKHPLLDDAAGTGQLSRSWAREIAGWTG